MKKIIIAFVTMLMLGGSYQAKSQINSSISFNTFYNELSPYGQWVNYPQYGQVWISNEQGFEPYSTNGHWEFTNYGWMWVSDYNWGWAPFHYGRWAYLNSYGWAWVPGYEWAPAWVGWCNYDGYYGWAPLSPGLGFNYSFGSIPVSYWRFVRPQYINDPYVYRHDQRPVRNANQYKNVTVINNTVVNNNVTYVQGPAQQDIESITKRKIEPKQVAFNNNNTDRKTIVLNDKKEVAVFRPDDKINNAGVQPKQQQQNIKTPAVESDKQTIAPQTAVQQKQELIKQKQAALNNSDNTMKQQLPQTETPVVKEQRAQNLDAIKQQQMIRRQQQDDAKQQAIIRDRQEQVRQQNEAAKQQEAMRIQQQNEARQQESIRRQQQQQTRQNEIRQQQRTQQPQMKQQQWNQQPSFQREVPQRTTKPLRKE